MIDERSLKQTIIKIVDDARILKNKHTHEKDAPVNYACIFTQSNNEFKEINSVAALFGEIIKQTPTGPLYHIRPLQTSAGKLKLLKIRKKDINRTERGDADFTVRNYQQFKKKNISKPGFNIIKRAEFEMMECIDNEFNVLVYFSNPPLDKQLGL